MSDTRPSKEQVEGEWCYEHRTGNVQWPKSSCPYCEVARLQVVIVGMAVESGRQRRCLEPQPASKNLLTRAAAIMNRASDWIGHQIAATQSVKGQSIRASMRAWLSEWERAANEPQAARTGDPDDYACHDGVLRYGPDDRATQPPGLWQPIETAPRDGTPILVANEERGGAWIAYYCPVYTSGYRPENPWESLMLNMRWHNTKWASTVPTKWMPIPNAEPGITVVAAAKTPSVCAGCGAAPDAQGEREHEANCPEFERLFAADQYRCQPEKQTYCPHTDEAHKLLHAWLRAWDNGNDDSSTGSLYSRTRKFLRHSQTKSGSPT